MKVKLLNPKKLPSSLGKVLSLQKQRDRQLGQRSSSPEGSEVLSFTFELPPSVNALYVKRRGGAGIALTETAKAYRETVKQVVVEKLAAVSRFPVSLEHIYGVRMVCEIDKLQNPGWFRRLAKDRPERKKKDKKTGEMKVVQKFKAAGEREAETRYKKLDVDNRIKFLQDCVIKSLGIHGDEQVFEDSLRKIERRGRNHAHVEVYVLNPVEFLESEEV
jgi:Holliday junction resolvase RusA-like endonuclease